MKGTVAKDMLHGADREIPERVIKRPFASVPFISEYEEPLSNSLSVQQIFRSAPCNISFASVPFFLEYEEPLNNKEAFCNRPDEWEVRTYKLSSYVQVRYPSQWSHGAERILKNRFPDAFLSNSISIKQISRSVPCN